MAKKKEVNIMKHKPTIETVINTAALAFTSFGVVLLTKESISHAETIRGLVLILVAMGLEFFKYWGRKANYW